MELFRFRIGVLSSSPETADKLIAQLPRSVEPVHVTDWDEALGPMGRHLDAVLHCLVPFNSPPCPLPIRVPIHTVGPEELKRSPREWESVLFLGSGRKEVYHPLNRLIGYSRALLQVKQLIVKVAGTEFPVVFTGENGTGKDLAATLAHELSSRRNGPFVAVNCGAIPTSLAEAQLFGSVRGAYTDAENREGVCQQASGGTLFLDEIGELPLEVQAKLLRVLETGDLRRVGSEKTETANFRLMCATNRSLTDAIREGRFRMDLLYRINVLPVRMPPLRERTDDIPDLARHFQSRRLLPAALRKLQNHDWPGNLRQLRNVLVRAKVLHDVSILGPEHIDLEDG